jgi:hypothetical protein
MNIAIHPSQRLHQWHMHHDQMVRDRHQHLFQFGLVWVVVATVVLLMALVVLALSYGKPFSTIKPYVPPFDVMMGLF